MYLIDAHSLIFQVFHAIPEMSSPAGLPTNALFGFTKDMLSLRDLKPDYLVCCFDVAGPTFRDKIYPEYKAHRAPMPNDLSLQIPLIHAMLDAMHIPVIGVEGFEADDVIATIATAAPRELEVLVCTSDKDCRQLIDDHIKLFNLRKNKTLDRSGLQEDWAVTPEQVVDLQALVGDSVDNVPGVPGIGLKTGGQAAAGVRHARQHPGQRGQDPRQEAGEPARVRRQGAPQPAARPPRSRCPHRLRLGRLEAGRLGRRSAARIVRRLGLPSLRRPGAGDRGGNAPPPAMKAPLPGRGRGARGEGTRQGLLFGDDGTPAGNGTPAPGRQNWHGTYHCIHTPELFADFLKELKQQKRVALELRTTNTSPRLADIVGIAFSWKEGEGWYLAVQAPAGETTLDGKAALDALRCVLENDAIEKVAENSTDTRIVLRQAGITLAGMQGDPMIADYLLHAGERSHQLDDLANRYLDHTLTPIEELVGKGKKQVCPRCGSGGKGGRPRRRGCRRHLAHRPRCSNPAYSYKQKQLKK